MGIEFAVGNWEMVRELNSELALNCNSEFTKMNWWGKIGRAHV